MFRKKKLERTPRRKREAGGFLGVGGTGDIGRKGARAKKGWESEKIKRAP